MVYIPNELFLVKEKVGFLEELEQSVIDELISNPLAPSLWKNLAPRIRNSAPKDKDSCFGFECLISTICEAMLGPIGWDKKTTKEQSITLQKISELALKLETLVYDTPLDNSILNGPRDFFNTRDLSSKYLNDEGVKRFPSDINEFNESTHEAFASIGIFAPSLSEYLGDLSSKAQFYIGRHPAILNKPDSDTASKVYFIRLIHMFFVDCLNSPLHSHVAIICSIFWGGDVSIDNVRNALKGWSASNNN